MALDVPSDYVLDVHDLATLILHCHARTDLKFPRAQLAEVYRGTSPGLRTLPPHVLPPIWDNLPLNQRRVAYLLRTDPTTTDKITLDTFPVHDGVKTPGDRPLTRRELEDIYWRCKDHDNGYMLAYVAQAVFDELPPTAKLRVRTSQGHEIICQPSDVAIDELDIQPHEACLILNCQPYPVFPSHHLEMIPRFSGFDSALPWIMFVFGVANDDGSGEHDQRCYLDLVTPQIGGRGGGAELFSLEQVHYYRDQVLSPVATVLGGYKHTYTLASRLAPPDVRRRANALTEVVLERLTKVANGGNDFCRYCGKERVETRCSKCKDAHFCKECQALGWKYHKVWCKPAEASHV